MPFEKGNKLNRVSTSARWRASRWGDKTDRNIRTQKFLVYASPEEIEIIMDKAERLGISRNELMIRGALEYEGGGDDE